MLGDVRPRNVPNPHILNLSKQKKSCDSVFDEVFKRLTRASVVRSTIQSNRIESRVLFFFTIRKGILVERLFKTGNVA